MAFSDHAVGGSELKFALLSGHFKRHTELERLRFFLAIKHPPIADVEALQLECGLVGVHTQLGFLSFALDPPKHTLHIEHAWINRHTIKLTEDHAERACADAKPQARVREVDGNRSRRARKDVELELSLDAVACCVAPSPQSVYCMLPALPYTATHIQHCTRTLIRPIVRAHLRRTL